MFIFKAAAVSLIAILLSSASSVRGEIVTIDGVAAGEVFRDLAVPNLDTQPPTGYLDLNLRQYLNSRNIQQRIFSVGWSNNPTLTNADMESIKNQIRAAYQRSREKNESFNIVAHSWGGVIAYRALRELGNEVKVDNLTTLGTPLGYVTTRTPQPCPGSLVPTEDCVSRYVSYRTKQNSGIRDMPRLQNVGEWRNHWSQGDPFSQPLPVQLGARNTRYRDVESVNMFGEHRAYYEWQSDNPQVRSRAESIFSEVASGIATADKTKIDSARGGPRPGQATACPSSQDVKELRELLAKLRAQVNSTQEALRRLNRSMQGDAAQRDEWERTVENAMESALERGKDMLMSGVVKGLQGRFEKQLEEADKEIRRAVDKLAGETDPNRREQLHAAIRLLDKERTDIREGLRVVKEGGRDIQENLDRIGSARSQLNYEEIARRSVDQAYSKAVELLQDEKVQRALKISKFSGQFATYAKSIVDSGYDITAEIVSWKRINQLNRNSEEYLFAVNRLSERMKSLVAKIKETEKKLVEAEQQITKECKEEQLVAKEKCPEVPVTESKDPLYQKWRKMVGKHLPVGKRFDC